MKGSRPQYSGAEWRQQQPWPKEMRFADAVTERIIDRRMPPRPVPQGYVCAGGMCAEARFAEGEVEGRVSR